MFLQKVRKQFRMVNPRGGFYPDILANILSMSRSTYLHICILNVASLNIMYGNRNPKTRNSINMSGKDDPFFKQSFPNFHDVSILNFGGRRTELLTFYGCMCRILPRMHETCVAQARVVAG